MNRFDTGPATRVGWFLQAAACFSLLMCATVAADASPGPIGDEYGIGDRAVPARGWWESCTYGTGSRVQFIAQAAAQDAHYGDLLLQRYDSAGKPVGRLAKVNDATALLSGYHLTCSDAGWVLAQWSQDGCMRQRVFDPSNEPAGASTTSTARDCRVRAGIAIRDGGTWTAAWLEILLDNDTRIFARSFGADSVPLGQSVQVSAAEAEPRRRLQSKVSIDNHGTALVAWMEADLTESGSTSIAARLLAPDGRPLDLPFAVNAFQYGIDTDPALRNLGDGDFEVAWTNALEGGRVARRVGVYGDSAPLPAPAPKLVASLPRFGTPRVVDSGPLLAKELAAGADATWILSTADGHYRSTDDSAHWAERSQTEQGSAREVLGSDGNGTWVKLIVANSDGVLRTTRSIDDGATWSVPTALYDAGGGPGDPGALAIVAGDGVWVAAWTRTDTGMVLVARSLDAGLSWSQPSVPSNVLPSGSRGLDLASDGHGTWVLAVADRDLAVLTSTDDAASWSVPQTLVAGASCGTCAAAARHGRLQVANDGGDNWVLAFSSASYRRDLYGADGDVFVLRSSDGGASWTQPAEIAANATTDGSPDFAPSIAVDDSGRWVVAWISHNAVGPHDDLDADVLVSMSTDAGATWSAPALLDSAMDTDAANDGAVVLASRGSSRWLAIWHRRPFESGYDWRDGGLVVAAADAACGNGTIEIGEQCDDGNSADDPLCDHDCTLPVCDNGIVDVGEQCDDGNLRDDDDCLSTCQRPGCGDGIVSSGEGCDDGNSVDTDECPNSCLATAFCGDGIVRAGYEQCDNGGKSTADCTPECKLPRCGDGYVAPWLEACDDGNTLDDDACPSDCSKATCGDGFTSIGFEECDPQDPAYHLACTADCLLATLCGDADGEGIVTAGDAMVILRNAVGLSVTCPRTVCDMNGDDTITGSDALMALRKAVGIEVGDRCSIGTGNIVFWIEETRPIGAFGVDIDYSKTGGSFVGEGEAVACSAMISGPNACWAFYNVTDQGSLRIGAITTTGFMGLTDLFRCQFEMPEQRAGVHFAIRIVSAVTPDGEQLDPLPLLGYRVD